MVEKEVVKLLEKASPGVRNILVRVLNFEKNNLHTNNPRYKDELIGYIKEEVK